MRREGEGWSFYRGDTPVAREGGRQAPCRARGLGPAAVARGLGDRPLSPVGGGRQGFFFRDLIANLKKKFTLKACRPMGGDREIFLKYFKTDIYF